MKGKSLLPINLSVKLKLFWFLGASFLFNTAANGKTLRQSPLTKTQAISRASTFYRRLGYKVPLSAVALHSSSIQSGVEQFPSVNDEGWHVVLKSGGVLQATIDVSIREGKVLSYMPETGRLPSSKKTEQVNSEVQAVQTAKLFLLIVDGDMVRNLSFERKDGYGVYEDKAQKEWFIQARRLYKSVPYRSQGANIVIDKTTGAIKAFKLLFDTPEPASFSIDLSPDQSLLLANQNFVLKSPLSETEKGIEITLQIVQPNKYWESGGEAQKLLESRLAWVCRYKKSDKLGWREVWVDTKTGKIVGGTVESLSVSPFEYAETNRVMNLLINRYVQAEEFIAKSSKLLSTAKKLTSSPINTSLTFDSPFQNQVTYFHKASVIRREPDISFTLPGSATMFGFYKGVGVVTAKLEQKIDGQEIKDWLIVGVAKEQATANFEALSKSP